MEALLDQYSYLRSYKLGEEEYNTKVTDKHLVTISSSYCKKWRSLYPYLDMTRTDVTNANQDGNDEESKRQRFLEGWKEKKGCDATYIKLINALLCAECRNDAENVCELLLRDKPELSKPPIPDNQLLVLPGMYTLLI